MYRRAFVAFVIVAAITASPNEVTAQGVRLIGSGASFPFPIYSAWFKDFSKQNDGVTVDYQAKGSRCRHPGLHQSNGRLCRERCGDD